VPVVIAVAVLLGLVAVLASRGGSDDGAAEGLEQTQPVEVTGEPLPVLAPGEDPALGRAAPLLDGRSFDGTPVELGGDTGAQVLFFVAHWCPHCQREVPVMAEWLEEEGRPDGVDLAVVATATTPSRPNHPPSSWLEEEGIDLPVLADDAEGSAAAAYGLSGFPFFVAVDEQGEVVARTSGEIGVEGFERLVDEARGA
jgi:thiol-disulfide isomerase/thioredoxin